jgi:cation diffusion facilitator CzcD-associated flavoprotein CzcO
VSAAKLAQMNQVEVAIIGAGLGGLCAAIQLQKAGITDYVILERAAEVGGTWRDNIYPGCACDIPSHLYSYSFEPQRDWSRPYPSQPEIQSYILALVQKYSLRQRLQLGSNVSAARWDAVQMRWLIEVNGQAAFSARFMIAALGPLNKVSIPDVPGRDAFAGAQFHSSQWRSDVPLAGKRVAVVGTGASAIQIVPELARTAQSLHVFQRTPSWLVPRSNHACGALRRWAYAHVPGLQRLNRWRIYWLNEWITRSYLGSTAVRGVVRWLALGHLKRQVQNPSLRAQLTPAYEPGCKRIAVSNHFYPALQQPHVHLVTQGIARLEPNAIVTADGTRTECDAIVWCTGFKVTEFVDPALKIVGENGVELGELWRTQPAQSYLGLSVAGFPNMFLVVGPNTGLGSNSIIFMIECQVRYMVQAIVHMQQNSYKNNSCLRIKYAGQQAFYSDTQRKTKQTVWTSGCASYYQSADGRLDTLWPGFTTSYWRLTRRFDPRQYEPLQSRSS